MATTNKQTTYGAVIHLMTTELNSLANNAQIVSSVNGTSGVFDNSTNLDLWIDARASFTFGVAPTAVTTLDMYFLREVDGSAVPDGATTTPPAQYLVCSFPVRAVTTAQVVDAYDIPLPPGKWKVVVVNNGTGQALAASGNTVDAYPHNLQNV